MSRFVCDLHVHSCLSPCGDDDMTPYSIAGMAKLNGLDMVALTDHNSCGNCATFFEACAHYGIIPVPGMELTTAEDIHLLCLFPTLDQALEFDQAVGAQRIRVKNRPQVFGNQLLIGLEDAVVGQEPDLLINATALTIAQGTALARDFGGVAYPAHIDRESNGIIAVLGDFPQEPQFAAVEYNDSGNVARYTADYGLGDRRVVVSSDAHQLWNLSEGDFSLELPCDKEPERARQTLVDVLNGNMPM